MQLESKIALVTGAGRGIGKAIAIGFAREGANVVAVSRTTSEIEETVNQARSLGVKAMAIRADVSLAGDVQRVADGVAKGYGRLDVLVNNAALRMNQLGRKDGYHSFHRAQRRRLGQRHCRESARSISLYHEVFAPHGRERR